MHQHYETLGAHHVARRLGRTIKAVWRKAGELGLSRAPRPWTDLDRAYFISHYGSVPNAELARRIDRTVMAVAREAMRLGLTRKRVPKREAEAA